MKKTMWFEHRVMLDGKNVFEYENDERADSIIRYLSGYEKTRGFNTPTVVRDNDHWVSVEMDSTHWFRFTLCTWDHVNSDWNVTCRTELVWDTDIKNDNDRLIDAVTLPNMNEYNRK